jgi:transcriptional regulator with XRE-family HTH domain
VSLHRVKFERLSKGWSQEELARRSGVRVEPLGLIEKGLLTPTEDQLLKLANALWITPPSVLLKPTVLKDEDDEPAAVTDQVEAAR